jgi:hypothetical protein
LPVGAVGINGMRYLTEPQEIQRKMSSAKASNEALQVKNKLFAQGYHFQVSLYMAIHDTANDTYDYRRIEVLTDEWWNEKRWLTVWDFFDHFTPMKTYSIWFISEKDDTVRFAEEWD